MLHRDTPVIFCVLTDNTMQQAIDRSGGKHGNKGVEASVAALTMATLRTHASILLTFFSILKQSFCSIFIIFGY